MTIEDAIHLGADHVVVTFNSKRSDIYDRVRIMKIQKMFPEVRIDFIPIETTEGGFDLGKVVNEILLNHRGVLHDLDITDGTKILIQAGDKPLLYPEGKGYGPLRNFFSDDPFERGTIIETFSGETLLTENQAGIPSELYGLTTILGETRPDLLSTVKIPLYSVNVNDEDDLYMLRDLCRGELYRPYEIPTLPIS